MKPNKKQIKKLINEYAIYLAEEGLNIESDRITAFVDEDEKEVVLNALHENRQTVITGYEWRIKFDEI